MPSNDETSMTEIAILPDGRIYVFGMSWQVLDMLADTGLADATLKQRAETLRRLAGAGQAAAQTCESRSTTP